MGYEELEREVEQFKLRKESAGLPLPERIDIGKPAAPLGDLMPEVVAVMEKARATWAAFCDSCRPEFDALPETKACPEHPTTMRQKLFEESCQETRRHGYFRAEWAPCPDCESGKAKAALARFWSRRGVPNRVIEATLSNYRVETDDQAKALAAVRDWIRRDGVFLILVGTSGTGKGHLASGCLKAQGNGTFITHADMLTDLRSSYTLHTTPALLEKWREAEMLVVDEFGVRCEGKDEPALLYQVFADRHDKRRPTIITSNLELPELKEMLGPRLVDRIAEDCTTVICRWASWRKRAA